MPYNSSSAGYIKALEKVSERRAEHLLNDLLISQGWILRRPPFGDVLYQNEYRSFQELAEALSKSSKSGAGFGVPEAILVDRSSMLSLAIIEAKPKASDIVKALSEAQSYADALWDTGARPLAIGLADRHKVGECSATISQVAVQVIVNGDLNAGVFIHQILDTCAGSG